MNVDTGRRAGFTIGDVDSMNVMSGSAWFDRYLVVLSNVLLFKAVQRRPGIESRACDMIVRFPA